MVAVSDELVTDLVYGDGETVGAVVITTTEEVTEIDSEIAPGTDNHPAVYSIRMLAALIGQTHISAKKAGGDITPREICEEALSELDEFEGH